MAGNGGEGFDHYCTLNEHHALWDPNRWHTDEKCGLFAGATTDGKTKWCKGKLVPTGTGSRVEIARAKTAKQAPVQVAA